VTLARVETNGLAAVLVSRDGVPVALTTIDASAPGIDQIVWILRPSKLAAISKSIQRLGEPYLESTETAASAKLTKYPLICRTLGVANV
jgi:hypothetical protein